VLVSPGAVASPPAGGEVPLRLIAPLAHAEAQRLGAEGQRRWLDDLVAEPWWRAGLSDVRVVAARTPAAWGREFSLFRDAMNPVMTPGLARRGRLAHRSPWIEGLYLAGASTHPGQWVSFCCISGVLAAERAHADAAC
jgi:phytoene dehydrogenase-like protein